MTKLIRTKLLRKFNVDSSVGIVTASLWDYILYRRNYIMDSIEAEFSTFIYSIFPLILALIVALTFGWILLPLWIVQYFLKRKKIIKKYGSDYINKTAMKQEKELEQEMEQEA